MKIGNSSVQFNLRQFNMKYCKRKYHIVNKPLDPSNPDGIQIPEVIYDEPPKKPLSIEEVPYWRIYYTKYDSARKLNPFGKSHSTLNFSYNEIIRMLNSTTDHRSWVCYPRMSRFDNYKE